MSDISNRILAMIQKRGISYGDLAALTAIPKSALQRYATGETEKIPLDRLEKMAHALNTTPAYLMGWVDSPEPAFDIYSVKNIIPLPETKKIPLLGSIACGEPILAEENIVDLIEIPKGVNATFALTCHGDSMTGARIMDGDIVYIHEQPDVENGQIAAVLIGDEATLKKVYKYPNMLVLRPENPAYEEMVYQDNDLDKVKIIGLAVSFHSAVRHHK